VVSMSIPILGGVIWATIGYQAVFVCASGIAVINLILSTRIRVRVNGAAPSGDAGR